MTLEKFSWLNRKEKNEESFANGNNLNCARILTCYLFFSYHLKTIRFDELNCENHSYRQTYLYDAS